MTLADTANTSNVTARWEEIEVVPSLGRQKLISYQRGDTIILLGKASDSHPTSKHHRRQFRQAQIPLKYTGVASKLCAALSARPRQSR